MLKKAIADAAAMLEHPVKQYALLRKFDAQVTTRALDDLVRHAFAIDEAARKAVGEQSLNPQNIETSIRKALLHVLFASMGLDKAKDG